MLKTALLLGGIALVLGACASPPHGPPHGPPPPVAPDISRVTPPPPPVETIRPRV